MGIQLHSWELFTMASVWLTSEKSGHTYYHNILYTVQVELTWPVCRYTVTFLRVVHNGQCLADIREIRSHILSQHTVYCAEFTNIHIILTASWHLKLHANKLFVQHFVQLTTKKTQNVIITDFCEGTCRSLVDSPNTGLDTQRVFLDTRMRWS